MYSDVVMRSAQPTSALPVTRNMPYYSASVPSRNQPRNMTGIYLGLEGNVNPPTSRGSSSLRLRKGVSQKVRTSAEDKRYKMVELLRAKEQVRGFKGQPLKKKSLNNDMNSQDENLPEKCIHPQQLQHRKWGPAKSADCHHFEDVIRQNPRNYTAIINNGVTRSENLTGFMSFAEQYGWDVCNMSLPHALVKEVQRIACEREDLAGLEECFKKVCKGNSESLHSLLPLRKQSARPGSYTTGFTVRSYQNPNKAELLADFGSQPFYTRPKTSPARESQYTQQPLVPAPYFFKLLNKPGTSQSSTKKRNSPTSQFEDHCVCGDKIVGVPGAGTMLQSLRQGRHLAGTDTDVSKLRRGTPRNDAFKDVDRHSNVFSTAHNTQPLEIRAEGFQLTSSEDRAAVSHHSALTEPSNTSITGKSTTNRTAARTASSKKTESQSLSTATNNMDGQTHAQIAGVIRLDLETEDGKKQEFFLNDNDK